MKKLPRFLLAALCIFSGSEKGHRKGRFLMTFLMLVLLSGMFLTTCGIAGADSQACIVSANVPSIMEPEETQRVTIRLQNIGTTTWQNSTLYRLGAGAPPYAPANELDWVNFPQCSGYRLATTNARVYLCQGVDVLPGQSYDFTFDIKMPSDASGSRRFVVQMVQDAGVGWFGEVGEWTIQVKEPDPTNYACIVSANVPSIMEPGKTQQVTIRLQNIGTSTWQNSTLYRLGAGAPPYAPANELDWVNFPQCSGYRLATTNARVYLCQGVDVLPGQSYDFTFDIKMPSDASGSRRLVVRMVQDAGVGWFGDVGEWTIGVGDPECPFSSVQARVQEDEEDHWTPDLTIELSENFRVGAFKNGCDEFAECCVDLEVTGPNGFSQTPGNGDYITPPYAGTYTFTVTCGALQDSATVNVIDPIPNIFSATMYYCVYESEMDGTQTVTRTISGTEYTLKASFLFGIDGAPMQGTGKTGPNGVYIHYDGGGGYFVSIDDPVQDAEVRARYADLGITDFTGFNNEGLEDPGIATYSMDSGVRGRSGRILEAWRSIAVDPDVIQLDATGELLFITGTTPGGDTQMSFRADDTGGGITGNKVDIYVGEGQSAKAVWGQTGGNRDLKVDFRVCDGTDTSCGIYPNCENCNAKDGLYCNGDIRECRDYYCSGYICDWGYCDMVTSPIVNCNDLDGWYDTGNWSWIEDPENECKEKEQKEQEYRDWTCGGGNCTYTVTNTHWIYTVRVRNKQDGTNCGSDGWYCNGDINEYRDYSCSGGSCTYTVKYTQDCNARDGCYRHGDGCNDRDYNCSNGSCIMISSKIHFDYYDALVNYCNGDEVWKHRRFHDFYCEDGTCTDHTSWVDDQFVENCNDLDGWYCNRNGHGYRKEYRNYSCSEGNCTYTVTSSENCNDLDGCYVYEDGCEDRDYYCSGGECKYSFDHTKRHTDGWYLTLTKRWIEDPENECKEKEQIEQEYRDYLCASGIPGYLYKKGVEDVTCTFWVPERRWNDTGNVRNKQDGEDCGSDYYEEWVNYCKGDEVWKHKLFHDFYCVGGTCTEHTSWENNTLVKNCNDDDGWYDTGATRWIDVPEKECKEKEQKEQQYLDFTCSRGVCSASGIASPMSYIPPPSPVPTPTPPPIPIRWVDTGNERNKPDGTVCGCTESNTLKECRDGTCTDTGICNSTICGADVACDGKRPGEDCEGERICNANCKCIPVGTLAGGVYYCKKGSIKRNPLGGAVVTIAGKSVTSDKNGKYSISYVPVGTHEATCGHKFYGRLSDEVTIRSGKITIKTWSYNCEPITPPMD